jgi:hypothetical protein
VALASTTAWAADDPIVDYGFAGSATDAAGGSSIEVFGACPGDPCNSVTEFGSDSVGSFWRWESTNARGGGFRITTTQELGETYTVGLRFSFDQVAPSWRKIIDYKNRAEDTGFYFYDSAIEFYPYEESVETFSAGEVLDLLAVREGTEGDLAGTFTVYAIGESGSTTPILSIDDQDGDSIPAAAGTGSILGFFFDDLVTGAEATSGGKVYSVRIWDRALDPSELEEALDETVPEDDPTDDEIVEEETDPVDEVVEEEIDPVDEVVEEETAEDGEEAAVEPVVAEEIVRPTQVDAGSGGLADSGRSRVQPVTLAVLLSLVLLTLPVSARVLLRRP